MALKTLWIISLLALLTRFGVPLDNGLSLTPPMGWLSWAAFGCELNCIRHPLRCINEQLYMDMADRMVEDGYLAAGYNFVNIDDCWMKMTRTADGRLEADADRFPSGIRSLAEYMHRRGLKLGIYADFGKKTCAGFPGSMDYLKLDAATFASWNVDMLKLDGCAVNVQLMAKGYPEMGLYLNQTKRPIVYSCSWPFYETYKGMEPNYTAVAESCNLWRSYNDIDLSWRSVLSIIDWMDKNQDKIIPAVGPGRWNDPDMLIIGTPQLTIDQAKVQMALWSIWASPLIMSNDLRFITKANRDILLNRKVIAVDQDPLGIMGRLVHKVSFVSIYLKPITPVNKQGDTSFAIAFFNRHPTDKAIVTVDHIKQIGLDSPLGYVVVDVFSGLSYGRLLPDDRFHCIVNPTGVIMVTASVA
ncbi:hypothetical protein M514_11138 [Trichuris suis]|uniref:Alpha-galactosidase n=1 Tax=Trichuris suis TaxID=68888 RepID=A0A085N8D5_9BILA|nr:hypothetical protein M513_11138 [Trichuris suis]KFD65731.1 hypothetical protein M514_11138 [Trichuris suis]